jgi:hypothetical protein
MVVMVSCKNCGKELRLTAVRIDTEESLRTEPEEEEEEPVFDQAH